MEKLRRLYHDESGHATQYALILVLVSVAIMAGATILGVGLHKLFANVIDLLPW